MNADAPMSAPPRSPLPVVTNAAVADMACAVQAAELVRHPGHAARAQARWSDLRGAAERLHTAVRPRFVSTVLVLGAALAAIATVAGMAIGPPWSAH